MSLDARGRSPHVRSSSPPIVRRRSRGSLPRLHLGSTRRGGRAHPQGGVLGGMFCLYFCARNIAAAFEFAQKLSQAKNSEEIVRIQTEFVRARLKFLGDEVRDLSEASSKTTAGAGKTPFFKTALD